jgi:hypothetical protein
VSKTTTVSLGERYFWALDDAFAVWFEYVLAQIELSPPDPWLADLAELWRGAVEYPDFGASVPESTPEQLRTLHAIGVEARKRAVEVGDVPRDFTRTGEAVVRIKRVLEVADGFLRLLAGTLPDDPHLGRWFLGTGRGWEMIPRLYDDDGRPVRRS